MTSYLLGDADPKIAGKSTDNNSFIPPYEHYYEEKVPTIYVDKRYYMEDGTIVTKKFDLVRRRYVD